MCLHSLIIYEEMFNFLVELKLSKKVKANIQPDSGLCIIVVLGIKKSLHLLVVP